MSDELYTQEFENLFCQTRDRIAYLDDLDDILRFPHFISKSVCESHPAASEFYLSQTAIEPDDDDELHIIRLAHRACSIHDNSAEIALNYLNDFSIFGAKNKLSVLGGIENQIKKYPLEVRALIYDLISLLSHGKPIAHLWADLYEGNTDALLKLVRIDKSAITTPDIAQIIRQRQFEGDWAFFDELANAIKKHPISMRDYRPVEVILTARFWREEFHSWPREDLYKFLEETEVLPRTSGGHESFRRTITGLGLKKDKGRPKKGK